jgi:hypothetical protein
VGFTTKTGEFRISDCELIRDGEDRRRRSGERRTVNGERQCKTGVLARYPLNPKSEIETRPRVRRRPRDFLISAR